MQSISKFVTLFILLAIKFIVFSIREIVVWRIIRLNINLSGRKFQTAARKVEKHFSLCIQNQPSNLFANTSIPVRLCSSEKS